MFLALFLCPLWAGPDPSPARAGVTNNGASPKALFGILEWNPEGDPKPEVLAIPAAGGPGQTIRPGRNILPVGTYRVVARLASRSGQTEVTIEPGGKVIYKPVLADIPWSLTLTSPRVPFDVYAPGRFLFTANEETVLLTNLPPSPLELGFRTGDWWARGTWPGRPGDHITWRVDYQDRATGPLVAGVLGLVPGLDLIVHRPQRVTAISTLTALLFYTAVGALILSKGQDLKGLDGGTTTAIPVGWVWGILAAGSLGHGFFTWQSALEEDQDTARIFRLGPEKPGP